MLDNRRNVEFLDRIKATQPGCHLSPDEPVGSDDAADAAAVVENKQVIAVSVEMVDIALAPRHFGQWPGTQPLIKDAIAQRLRSIDVCGGFCQPDLQGAGPDIDDSRPRLDRFGRWCRINWQDWLLLVHGPGDHRASFGSSRLPAAVDVAKVVRGGRRSANSGAVIPYRISASRR